MNLKILTLHCQNLNSFSFDNMDVGEISSVELGVRNQEEKWFVKFGCPMKFYIKLTPYEAPLPAHLADFCSIGLKVPDLGPP